MSYRNRLAIFLGALALLPASGCQDNSPGRGQYSNVATTDDSTPIAAPPYDFSRDLFRSVPDGAVVTLELDKTEYLLGENVLVHYVLENTSDEPFQFSIGGDYRAAVRSLRYRVTATDENGKPVADANPWASCLGGLLGKPTLKPGEKRIESLALLRYCKFDKPGRYKIRVEHDLGCARRTVASGLSAKRRSPSKCLRRVRRNASWLNTNEMPASESESMQGRKAEYADFSVLRLPVYLQPLTKRAERGFQPAVTGIGNIETQAATAVLIDLLDHKDDQIVLLAAYMLNARLPDPQFQGQLPGRAFDASKDRRQRLAKATWNSDFAESIARRRSSSSVVKRARLSAPARSCCNVSARRASCRPSLPSWTDRWQDWGRASNRKITFSACPAAVRNCCGQCTCSSSAEQWYPSNRRRSARFSCIWIRSRPTPTFVRQDGRRSVWVG